MITHLEHIALSVKDIEKSLTFYCGLLGMKELRRLNAGRGEEKLGVVTGMRNCQACIIHLGLGSTMLELFQYIEPEGRTQLRKKQADHGLIHIGFTSTDTRADYERLVSKGVKFVSEPLEFRRGVWIVYFFGPDGEVCELRESS